MPSTPPDAAQGGRVVRGVPGNGRRRGPPLCCLLLLLDLPDEVLLHVADWSWSAALPLVCRRLRRLTAGRYVFRRLGSCTAPLFWRCLRRANSRVRTLQLVVDGDAGFGEQPYDDERERGTRSPTTRGVDELSRELVHCTALRVLDLHLRGGCVDETAAVRLADSLPHGLRLLGLQMPLSSALDGGARALADGIAERLRGLHTLCLGLAGGCVGIMFCVCMCIFPPRTPHPATNNGLGDAAVEALRLPRGLRRLDLNLANNEITDAGLQRLLDHAFTPPDLADLREARLDLSDNAFQASSGRLLGRLLWHRLRHCTDVALAASGNRLGDLGMTGFTMAATEEGAPPCCCWRSLCLRLSCNDIGRLGASRLRDALFRHGTAAGLVHLALHLEWNHLQSAGCAALLNPTAPLLLGDVESLTLDLSGNGVDGHGQMVTHHGFYYALSVSLDCVVVGTCAPGLRAITAAVDALRAPRLSTLTLLFNHNMLSDGAEVNVAALLALRRATGLQALHLELNGSHHVVAGWSLDAMGSLPSRGALVCVCVCARGTHQAPRSTVGPAGVTACQREPRGRLPAARWHQCAPAPGPSPPRGAHPAVRSESSEADASPPIPVPLSASQLPWPQRDAFPGQGYD